MSKQKFDIFGIGQCAWDYIGQIDAYPKADSKTEIPFLIMQGGGPVATALVALKRWGFSCSFCGVIGDDLFGRQIISSLDEENVNTDSIIIRNGFDSQLAFIVAEKNGGRRTIFWRRPTGEAAKEEELDDQRIRDARLLHTDGLFPEASIAAARIARETGIPVIVDAGTLREGMLELARYSDYYIVSETFAKALTGNSNSHQACKSLQKLGPRVVGVTLGDKGYLILSQDNWIEGSAYKVKSIDTTGCGDIFHAGISYGVLHNWPLKKMCDFAAWAAAQVSTRLGGRDGIPPVERYPNPMI
jgi:sulfofructose kinase